MQFVEREEMFTRRLLVSAGCIVSRNVFSSGVFDLRVDWSGLNWPRQDEAG